MKTSGEILKKNQWKDKKKFNSHVIMVQRIFTFV